MSKHSFLGPFIGHTTTSSVKIWMHNPTGESLWLCLEKGEETVCEKFEFTESNLFSDCVEFGNLSPDTVYKYQVCESEDCSKPFDLDGLEKDDLFFRTLPPPKESQEEDDRLDFLVMSCHDPDSVEPKKDGYKLWSTLPQILKENQDDGNYCIRFALLAGDQVYADKWRKEIDRAKGLQKEEVYLDVYRHYWSNLDYRKILCRLPSYLMWDDHEIMDGWGSSQEFFNRNRDDFTDKAKSLFVAADKAFTHMQGIRNPIGSLTISNGVKSHDFCFKAGHCGFIMADLRSNRDLFDGGRNGEKGKLWEPEQLDAIKDWVNSNLDSIDTLFFVTPVVMTHGTPVMEGLLMRLWNFFYTTPFINRVFKKILKKINLGDIRDDVRDSWGVEANANETEKILNFLFSLQNSTNTNINVVVLSGDIHAAGYASIYSSQTHHSGKSVIPHVVASPVGSKPFPWLLEAVYRKSSKVVRLGTEGHYTAQISHHHSHRNVVVCSVRTRENGKRKFLKIKFYLEEFPEPQIVIFDLKESSHKENIQW